jgi:hypothetical protein
MVSVNGNEVIILFEQDDLGTYFMPHVPRSGLSLLATSACSGPWHTYCFESVRLDDLQPLCPGGNGVKFFSRQQRPARKKEVVLVVGLGTTIETPDEWES